MGLVHISGMLGRNKDELTEVRFLVDTGSFYTAITPELRTQLRLPPGIPALTRLADGRVVETEGDTGALPDRRAFGPHSCENC
jgi:hypothetical protein